ncbi:MAG: hypothetical protein WAM73_20795 [Desulfobacterales bacterium]
MRRDLLALVFAGALLGGCTYYQPAPGTYVTTPAGSFDRSWAAATGALQDQGVQITAQDRSAGSVRGTRDGIVVTANVRTQADGSVRVEFNTAGATERDPGLIDRISQSYDRRMGR